MRSIFFMESPQESYLSKLHPTASEMSNFQTFLTLEISHTNKMS